MHSASTYPAKAKPHGFWDFKKDAFYRVPTSLKILEKNCFIFQGLESP